MGACKHSHCSMKEIMCYVHVAKMNENGVNDLKVIGQTLGVHTIFTFHCGLWEN